MDTIDVACFKKLIVERAFASGFTNKEAFAERLERSAALNNIDFERFITSIDQAFMADADRVWRDQVPTCLVPPPTREERLEKALNDLAHHYAELLSSGDYGQWDDENDGIYQQALKALA